MDFCEMQELQRGLQARYRGKWQEICPRTARDKLLWMMIEAGEVADIIKKKGDTAIMEDIATREHLVEELCDVLMYFNDVMLCYDISADDLETVYRRKMERNMGRWTGDEGQDGV